MSTEKVTSSKLEPRVAKLEVGLDRLTDDVRDLANVVRNQGSQMEQEIQKLVVAVTMAAGPKKTDWQTIIAGIALVMAIGSAVFWPLNQQVQDTKNEVEKNHVVMADHMKQDGHPVDGAAIKRMDDSIKTHIQDNEKQLDDLKVHLHEEILSEIKSMNLKIEDIQGKNDLYIDKLFGRVQSLESERIKNADKEHDELMQWRQKAMGLVPVK